MTNAFTLFKSLVIYGICLPLAILVGYMLATPLDIASIGSVGVLIMLMTIPLFLRFHYAWMIFSWNTITSFYFLPGKPSLSLLMIFVSFGFSVLAYVMNRNSKFISAPSVARPLIFLGIVVLATAKLTGGIGLNILGSDAIGGKRYIFLLSGIVGFFALTAEVIPSRKAGLYINLFFLGALTSAVGNLVSIISPSFYFIFLIFPPDLLGQSTTPDMGGITRLSGISLAAVGMLYLILARFGIKGTLDLRKAWRLLAVIAFIGISMLGGFRSKVIEIALTLGILFYLEGLMRSRLLPALILAGIFAAALILPFASDLPLSIQRSLTFVPGLKLDYEAEVNAQASTDWRIAIWKNVIPTIPQYFILGKGLAIDPHDMDMLREGMNKGEDTGYGAAMAGDYHNGPLSVIIPFGIFGVIGFVWFIVAAIRVLYRNYKYGDPAYAMINRFLLTFFLVKLIMFVVIIGSLYSDLVFFTGPLGLSIALNGGVLSPAKEPVVQRVINRFKLVAAAR